MADGMEKVDVIAWHPAFCSAAEYVLRKDRACLEFEPEHNLSREPLRIDLLIIKKAKNKTITNDIARIFRQYNVIEYKSPGDSLTIDDFYKTIGYACLYKAAARSVDEIPSGELTVSVFRESYPELLFEKLASEGLKAVKTASGVYAFENMKPFPAQIVVTGELDPEHFSGLRILSRKAKAEDIRSFIAEAEKEELQGEKLNINAILEVSYAANRETFTELKRRNPLMSEAMKFFMKDELEAAERNGREAGRKAGEKIGREAGEKAGREAGEKAAMKKNRETANNLHKMGLDISSIAKAFEVTDETVRNWLGAQPA